MARCEANPLCANKGLGLGGSKREERNGDSWKKGREEDSRKGGEGRDKALKSFSIFVSRGGFATEFDDGKNIARES